MTTQSGGAPPIPGLVPHPVDGIGAAFVEATDPNQISTYAGGILVQGQGITTEPDFGQIPLDSYYSTIDGIFHLALRVTETGMVWVYGQLAFHTITAGAVGAANGTYITVYNTDGSVAGKLPLYA